MPDMMAQVLHLKQGDEIALWYLGAAVVLQWGSLPEKAQQAILQQAILQQANSVGGLPPVTSLNEQIKSLIQRIRD